MRYSLTASLLAEIYSVPENLVQPYVPWLIKYCREYNINTPLRLSAFLAQIAYESGRLRYVEEIASGAAYEGRLDLGNTEPGDGMRYKGRGLIQITGRYNYTILSEDTGIDFIANPHWLLQPQYAVLSACWFWARKGLNGLADSENFKLITKKVNGGYTGLADRDYFYRRCKQAFIL